MVKTVFLYVHGEDYAALQFEDNFNAEKVYFNMLSKGIKECTLYPEDGGEIEVSIEEFEFYDKNSEFELFIKNELCDYDQLKSANIYEVACSYTNLEVDDLVKRIKYLESLLADHNGINAKYM